MSAFSISRRTVTMTPQGPTRNPQPPEITQELVEWLSFLHPERTPREEETDRAIWMSMGARKLVRRIIFEMEQQQKEQLNNVSRQKAP